MDSKWWQDLDSAKRGLLVCERLFYVGISILKDNRILTRVIRELARTLIKTINAYVKYESVHGRVKTEVNFSENLNLFFKKIAPRYVELGDISLTIKLLAMAKIHKESEMEFVRHERLIMFYNGRYESIDKKDILKYFRAIKRLINAFPLEKA